MWESESGLKNCKLGNSGQQHICKLKLCQLLADINTKIKPVDLKLAPVNKGEEILCEQWCFCVE